MIYVLEKIMNCSIHLGVSNFQTSPLPLPLCLNPHSLTLTFKTDFRFLGLVKILNFAWRLQICIIINDNVDIRFRALTLILLEFHPYFTSVLRFRDCIVIRIKSSGVLSVYNSRGSNADAIVFRVVCFILLFLG